MNNMQNFNDPRLQIPTNLDEVQKDIEKAVDERKKEIKQEIKDQKSSLKDGVKDLKQEAKDSFNEYKEYKKDSYDPVADEKIATAREASKVVTKGIEVDYDQTVDRMEEESQRRLDSLDRMLDDSDDARKNRYNY